MHKRWSVWRGVGIKEYTYHDIKKQHDKKRKNVEYGSKMNNDNSDKLLYIIEVNRNIMRDPFCVGQSGSTLWVHYVLANYTEECWRQRVSSF